MVIQRMAGIASYLFFFFGVATVAFYPFPSGGVQPSHIALLGFALIVVCTKRIRIQQWSLFFLLLVTYSAILNSLHGVRDAEFEPLIHSAYLAYDLFMCLAIYAFFDRRATKILFWGLVIAAAISMAVTLADGVNLVAGGNIRGRSTGLFNNPNQLGFFSVVLISFYFLFGLMGVGRAGPRSILILAAFFLAVASLSKAAIIANLAVAAVIFFPKIRGGMQRRILGLSLWMACTFAVASGVTYLYANNYLDDFSFVRRLQNMENEKDSSLTERGYFAIAQGSPVEVVFGLGNSKVETLVGHEVHSTFAAMFNVYGIAGFILFALLMLAWVVKLRRGLGILGVICIAGPSFLYGISHNGTRFVPFWILFAVSLKMAAWLRPDAADRFSGSKGPSRAQSEPTWARAINIRVEDQRSKDQAEIR